MVDNSQIMRDYRCHQPNGILSTFQFLVFKYGIFDGSWGKNSCDNHLQRKRTWIGVRRYITEKMDKHTCGRSLCLEYNNPVDLLRGKM